MKRIKVLLWLYVGHEKGENFVWIQALVGYVYYGSRAEFYNDPLMKQFLDHPLYLIEIQEENV